MSCSGSPKPQFIILSMSAARLYDPPALRSPMLPSVHVHVFALKARIAVSSESFRISVAGPVLGGSYVQCSLEIVAPVSPPPLLSSGATATEATAGVSGSRGLSQHRSAAACPAGLRVSGSSAQQLAAYLPSVSAAAQGAEPQCCFTKEISTPRGSEGMVSTQDSAIAAPDDSCSPAGRERQWI